MVVTARNNIAPTPASDEGHTTKGVQNQTRERGAEQQLRGVESDSRCYHVRLRKMNAALVISNTIMKPDAGNATTKLPRRH